MSCLMLILLAFVSCIEAFVICPYGDYSVCGKDGRTYNLCLLELARMNNPDLDILHLGRCGTRHDRYQSQSLDDDKNSGQYLRKRPNTHHDTSYEYEDDVDEDGTNYSKPKKLSSSASWLINRLMDTTFNFRRDQQQQQE